MLREIILDVETTGLNFNKGDKIIEIGCMELIDKIPTGRFFHSYINPNFLISKESYLIHGLNNNFLSDCDTFPDISDNFLNFIKDSTIVAHNAQFDMGFINNELTSINKKPISYNRVVDTLDIARNIFPNKKNNLNILCKRFFISIKNRTTHSALIDSQLLADVYYNLNFLKIIGYKSFLSDDDEDNKDDEYMKNSGKFMDVYRYIHNSIAKNKTGFPNKFLF